MAERDFLAQTALANVRWFLQAYRKYAREIHKGNTNDGGNHPIASMWELEAQQMHR